MLRLQMVKKERDRLHLKTVGVRKNDACPSVRSSTRYDTLEVSGAFRVSRKI